ncbi:MULTISPECIES: carbohydrate ABC transporter permease [Paracoccaceae]|jgi:multiple sugar transport system permease protein|uniref:carbohydrate ABC transporter permease n=1 Tax=Rhodobacterales TaxID=204455 RepID=UPI001B2174A5|nr:sugar ABC transporter permease [Boseongicola sp. H5]MBO6602381.1 sugar ABC transporter permease [Roseicyclus sp.]MBO6623800.1 sugar ABC transporter permease [Roseicyclus sp.]MBO6922241.1 sugar ABC transporter permease [Roseicyclus sp.]
MTRILRSLRDGIGFDVLLVIIALSYLLVFAGLPLIYNVIISFQTVDVFSLGTLWHPNAGFDNYRAIFDDPLAGRVLWQTIVFTLGSVALQFTFGFALALFFHQNFTGATWIRGLFLAAWVMPGLVVGVLWNWLLSGDFGVINHLLESLGLIEDPVFWRSNVETSLYAVLIANIWYGTPFNMILLAVGLAAIPGDLYEAAELDGANAFQRFWTITLPMMRATIGAVLALGIIFTLQQFDLFAAITQGGPAGSSTVAQYWSWQLSFREFDFGRGAVISVLMIIVVLFVSLIYVRSTKAETQL